MLALTLFYYLLVGVLVTAGLTWRYCQRLGCSADEFVMQMAELSGYEDVARRGFRRYAAAYYFLMVVLWPFNLLLARH